MRFTIGKRRMATLIWEFFRRNLHVDITRKPKKQVNRLAAHHYTKLKLIVATGKTIDGIDPREARKQLIAMKRLGLDPYSQKMEKGPWKKQTGLYTYILKLKPVRRTLFRRKGKWYLALYRTGVKGPLSVKRVEVTVREFTIRGRRVRGYWIKGRRGLVKLVRV